MTCKTNVCGNCATVLVILWPTALTRSNTITYTALGTWRVRSWNIRWWYYWRASSGTPGCFAFPVEVNGINGRRRVNDGPDHPPHIYFEGEHPITKLALKYKYGRGHPTQEVGPGHPQISSGHSMLCYVNRSQHYITTSFRFLASLINTWCSTQGQGNSTGTPIELPSLGLFLWVMSVLGKISTVVLPLSIQLVYVKSIFLYSLINSLIKIILPAQVKGKGIDVISSSGMWFETCIGDNDCLNNCFSTGGR